jgi:uncharacterized protein
MSTRPLALAAGEARALALAASLPSAPHADSAAVLRQLGLLQLDPLTRVDKAHRLTCLARMGPSATAGAVDAPLWAPGTAAAFEAWVHAACLVPVEDWPLLRLARERALSSPKRPPREVLSQVRDLIEASPDGATISQIEQPGNTTRGWDWSDRKRATEHMLRTGELICSARRDGKRVFDLPERRLPATLLDARPAREEILAAMATRALTALGVATSADIAAYYNITPALAREGLQAAGARPAEVQDWGAPAWLLPGTPGPLAGGATGPVLVGPFDNLIWDRDRTRRIFAFHYTFEAYKPQAKRKYGYYVLALVNNGAFLGRADIRRDSGNLSVIASFPEPEADQDHFKTSLDAAIGQLERQLGCLDRVPGFPSQGAVRGQGVRATSQAETC